MNMRKILISFAIGAGLAFSGPLIGKAISAEAIKNSIPRDYGKISKLEVLWMYTMKTRFWPDGQKITVFYMPFGSKTHRDFCVETLGMTTSRFEKNVQTYVNTGNAAYFIQLDHDNQMLSKVNSTVGSIGYISSNTLIVNRGDHVQILSIAD